MPNHFHLLLRIKKKNEIIETARRLNTNFKGFPGLSDGAKPNLQGFPGLSDGANLEGFATEKIITNQFSKFFNSYAKAFNKQQNRKGSLFMKNFKHKPVTDEKYLRKLVHYIHHNPVEAGLCKNPAEWKFSSFCELISEDPTILAKDEIINWFNDRENFIFCHKYPPNLSGIEI